MTPTTFPAVNGATEAASPLQMSDTRPADSRHTGERRKSERRHASLVPSITGVRLSPRGGEAFVVNISKSGVLLRANVRLMPGTPVTVNLDGTFRPSAIASRVVRCMVTDIDSQGVLWYHVGAVFNQAIALDDEPAAATEQPAAPQTPEPRNLSTASKNRW